MRFKILGPLEITDDDGLPVAVSRRLHRLTLSLLLLNASQPCSVNGLITALWGDRPPLSPEVSLRSCVYGIRKLLPDSQRVRTHPSGYLIQVNSGELDLHTFRNLVAGGRDALDSGNPLDAATMLAQALELWRDPPLADLPDVHDRDKLVDQHKEAQDALMDARLALGRHRQVLAELRSVVTADPLREHAWAQLMTALYRCGARAESLAAFGRLRMTLVTTYGIEPGPELQDLHRQVLADDPALMHQWQAPPSRTAISSASPAALDSPGSPASAAASAFGAQAAGPHTTVAEAIVLPRSGRPGTELSLTGPRPAGETGSPDPMAQAQAQAQAPVPGSAPAPAGESHLNWPAAAVQPVSQLPASVADFTGRAAELTELRDRLPGGGMAITVLSGMPGSGKTELAVRAAHLARAQFPDGQLYACLDDAGLARDPQIVLGELLRGMGVPPSVIPISRFECEAMYRSVLAGRRVLVLADGAMSAAQVRPLLPSSPGSAILITSRSRLSDLEGARLIELDGMHPVDSVSLLGQISGREMAGQNAESALAICAHCGYLPLAIRIAGARLADDPDLAMPDLAELLTDDGRRLDELAIGDQSVRDRLGAAAQSLSGLERTVLALLAATGPRDTPSWLIASLLDDPAAGSIAPALVSAGLLHRVTGATMPGGGRGTAYRLHPLVRSYAGELLAEANPGVVGAATGRLLASGWLELANSGENRASYR